MPGPDLADAWRWYATAARGDERAAAWPARPDQASTDHGQVRHRAGRAERMTTTPHRLPRLGAHSESYDASPSAGEGQMQTLKGRSTDRDSILLNLENLWAQYDSIFDSLSAADWRPRHGRDWVIADLPY